MPNPLSADIRARFEVFFAQGLSGREIGRRLMISAASASRLSQKLKQGLRLATLRERAMAAAVNQPSKGQSSSGTVFERSRAVRDYVFARANGKCEDCGEPAPFQTSGGAPFFGSASHS